MSRISRRRLIAGAFAASTAAVLARPLAALAAVAVDPRFVDYYTRVQGERVLGPAISPPAAQAQYFEKGRLEDHRGQGLPPEWEFMYGRLAAELIELGAPIPVAGESGPTYADLRAQTDPARRQAPPKQVTGVQATRGGVFVPVDPALRPVSGHIVPLPFWSYINRGDLFPGGWLHDIGLPLTPAIQAEVRKGRAQRRVTIQAFERTVLTHDPANPPDWQVERANIGLHYQQAGFIPSPDAPRQAVVSVGTAILRRGPSTATERVDLTYARHIVHIVGVVRGQPVDGDNRWYQLTDGTYISATVVRPFTPPTPPRTWSGRWIDVDLKTFYATAYEDGKPLYSALITAGRENRTPRGVFAIQHRVRNETMDSATVGFPPGHPEHYYLPNVEYTQYFKEGGFAIHGNYWVHPANFGRFSSNGCIGMLTPDAGWFWQFASLGTPVYIHD